MSCDSPDYYAVGPMLIRRYVHVSYMLDVLACTRIVLAHDRHAAHTHEYVGNDHGQCRRLRMAQLRLDQYSPAQHNATHTAQ